jgi:F0F1-type ATP synthase assembly protein I
MRYAGLGLQLAATVLLGVFAGEWLDRRLGTTAVFTILGAFLGLGGTLWSLIRSLNRDNKGDS